MAKKQEPEQTEMTTNAWKEQLDNYRPMLEVSPDATILYDSKGQVRYVNPAFSLIFGWELSEIEGDRLDFVPEENKKETAEAIDLLIKGEAILPLTTRRFTKDGRIIDVQVSANLLKDAEQNTIGSVIVIRDITQQKETERALEASQRRYRQMLESTPDAYYEVDLNGSITYFSKVLSDVLGYPEEELMGLNYKDYADEENAHHIFRAFNKVHQTGEPQKTALMHTIRKDGTRQILESSIALLQNHNDKVIGFRGIARDVTERVQAEDVLAEVMLEQERLASQLEIVAKISTAVSTILDPQEMLQAVVEQTKNNFDLYHTHIYLLDETKNALVLSVGAGDIGKQMVKEGREIPLDQEQSLVARAAREHTGVIVNNVRKEEGFLPHPLLPDTQSEMAIPMVVGDQVFGVVDIQSDKINRFTRKDVNIQTTLAAQVGVALQNARLFAQAQERAQELEESKNLLDLVIESLPVGLFMKEANELRFVRWNKSNEEITGLKSKEVLGKNDYDFFPQEQAEFFISKDREVIDSGDLLDIAEETIDTPHKGPRILHTRKIPILDNDGNPLYMLGISEDITDRLQQEAAFKLQQTLLEAQSEASPDGILLVTADREITFYNQNFVNMWGIPNDVLDTRSSKETVAYVSEQVASSESFKETSDFLYENPGESSHDELVLTDGRIFDRQTQPIKNEDGSYYGRVWYFRDITERKASEQALKEAHGRAQDILESVTTPLLISSVQDGKIQYTNELLADMVGVPLATLLEQGTPDFYVRAEDRTAVVDQIRKNGHVNNYELELKRETGEHFWALLSARLFNYQNEAAIITTLIDITDRKQAENRLHHQAEIEKLGRALSANFLNMSHEQIDAGITDALQQLGEFAHVDRAYLFRLNESADGVIMQNTHEWCAPGIEPQIDRLQALPYADYPFFQKYMDQQDVYHFPRVADMPAEAGPEKAEYETEDIQSIIIVPLVSEGKTIGFIGFDSVREEKTWDEANIGLLRLISDIMVSTFSRQEARAALSQSLDESERLYQMSTKLNATNTIEEILGTAVIPSVPPGASAASLFTIDLDKNGRPEWIEMTTTWQQNESVTTVPIGSRFYLPEYPGAAKWINDPDEPDSYEDVPHDEHLDPAAKAIYEMVNVQATVNLPLRLGDRWIGLLNISWNTPQTFTDQDRRIFKSLADQTAVILNTQQLFDQTQKRATELEAVAEVSSVISNILDEAQLLQTTVDLITDKFGVYFTGIYLLNEDERTISLGSGSGEIGQQMRAQNKTIRLDQANSVIAKTARSQEGIIVVDQQSTPDYEENPLLPLAHARITVPIISGEETIGVLDMQCDDIGRFSETDLRVMSALTPQIVTALNNARSFARSEKAVQELEDITKQLRREGWESYFKAAQIDNLGYKYAQNRISPLAKQAKKKKQAKQKNGDYKTALSQPLKIHGEPIGNLLLAEPESLTDDADDIMAAVAERLSAHIENLRLTEQTQLALSETEVQAHRLVVLNEISNELSSANYLTDIYHIAVERTAELLNADRASLPLLLPNGEQMQVVAHHGEEMSAPAGTILQLEETPMLEAIKSNKLVHGSTTGTIHSVRVVPINVGGQVIGTLNVGSYKKDFFDERDESLLQQMATILGSIIENKQLLNAAETRAQREQRLREVAAKIRSSADVEMIMRTAVQEIGQTLGRQTYLHLHTENDKPTDKDA